MKQSVKDRLTEAGKKLPIFIFAPLLSALGISLCLKAALGLDPISLFIEGLSKVLGMAYSNASLLYNGSFILLACILAWKNIYIGTVLSGMLMGPFLKVYEHVLAFIDPASLVLWQRFLFFAVGQVIMCLGISVNVSLRFGLGSSDAIIFKICSVTGWHYKDLKMTFDATYLTVGFLMGGVLGVGTVLSMLTTGPIVEVGVKFLNRTLLKKLGLQNPLNEMKAKKKSRPAAVRKR